MPTLKPKIITTSEGWTFRVSNSYLPSGQTKRGEPTNRVFLELTVIGCPPDFRATHHGRRVERLKTMAEVKAEVGKLCCCTTGLIPGYKVRNV